MIFLREIQAGEQVYLALAPNFVLELTRVGSSFEYHLSRRYQTRKRPQLQSFYANVLSNQPTEITLRPTVRQQGGIVQPPYRTGPIGYQFIRLFRRFSGQSNSPTRQRMVVIGSTFSSRRRIAETRQTILPAEQPQMVYPEKLYEEVRIG